MSDRGDQDAPPLYGAQHVERYRETGGEVGHEWRGTHTLLLTTTGRRSGESRTTPLIYGRHGDDYLVVASKGGSDTPPAWYRNLEENPEVEIQVKDRRMKARARTATPEEKPELWETMIGEWPDYDKYQQGTDREIPVVVLEPA
jgi:deazaflavin-dependent oxidoreductase (nitroreductase family)